MDQSDSNKSIIFPSLGHLLFLSVLSIVDGIVGNSSSGIIESPSLKTGTINIGNRQNGREMVKSVINCKPVCKDIDQALKKLFSKKFLGIVKEIKNPYERDKTTSNILYIIKNTNIPNKLNKKFYDLNY